MHAWENCLETWSSGGGISGGGERGDQSHKWNIAYNPNQGQSLVNGQPLFWAWKNHPITSKLSGHSDRNKIKERKIHGREETITLTPSRGHIISWYDTQYSCRAEKQEVYKDHNLGTITMLCFLRSQFNNIRNKGKTQSQVQTGQPGTQCVIISTGVVTWPTTSQIHTSVRVSKDLALRTLAFFLHKNIIRNRQVLTPNGYTYPMI